jgi:hypothetical protein
VEQRHLLLWRLNREAFLTWLARTLKVHAGVRRLDACLWQLGHLVRGDVVYECFFHAGGTPSVGARRRLLAYRQALLLRAVPEAEPIVGFQGPCLSLLEVLRWDRGSVKIRDIAMLLGSNRSVHFDAESGGLWAGDIWLGDVPLGSKEYHFLTCLADQQDRFVAYSDLKREVLRRTSSRDTTEEATFCQRLKSRIKKWVPQIDALIVTTNKADGYRLRAVMEA